MLRRPTQTGRHRPVITRASSTAATVTGIRSAIGADRIAISGSSAPTANDSADDECGLPRVGQLLGIEPELDLGVRGDRIMVGEFLGDGPRRRRRQPFGLIQRREFFELGDGVRAKLPAFLPQQRLLGVALRAHRTYSPSAIDTAPAAKPATPAVMIGPRATVAAATPTTMPAVDTIPSLAPSTPARNQFKRAETEPRCGSCGCDLARSQT